MAIHRASHAVYDTTYHLVWCPKYRKRLFAQEYLARTVGDSMTGDIVKKYIQHHREKQAPAQLDLEFG